MRIIVAAAHYFTHRVWALICCLERYEYSGWNRERRNYRYSLRNALSSLCDYIGCRFGPENNELEHEHQVAGDELDNE
jgi:hypothetical protein